MSGKEDLKVLMVDDLLLARHLLRMSLNKLGIVNIVEANNGLKALEMLEECHAAGTPVNLILCDINMPEMNGLQFLQTVRSDERFKNTPFVVVSVSSDSDSAQAALEAGATEHFIKPLNAPVIEKKLAAILKTIA